MGWLSVSSGYAVRLAYDGGGNVEYVGEVDPKDQNNATRPVWRVRKLVYDGGGNVVAVLWANSSKAFEFRWTARATYTYGG